MTSPPSPTPVLPVRSPVPNEWLSPGVLLPGYLLLMVVGYFLFTRGYCTRAGNELSTPQRIMVTVNAATLTGFQQARNPADYTPVGRLVTLGLMVGGTLFSLIGGGLAVTRIARLPYRDGTIATTAAAAVGLALASGTALLGAGRRPFDAAYQTLSAFANGGLYTGRLPTGTDPRTLLALMPLAFLGSLGVPVLLDLGRGRPSRHTVRVLVGSASVYLIAVAVLIPILAWGDRWADTVANVPAVAARASWVVANARTAGFPFQFATYLPAAAAVVVLGVMLVGGAPGGTAGGLKVTTLATLAGGVADAVRGRPARRAFGVAVGWTGLYAGVVALTWLSLVLSEPDKRPDRLLFLAASAAGNVGLSHDPVVPSTAGLIVLSLTMLAGRVGPVLLLWSIADRMPDVDEPIG